MKWMISLVAALIFMLPISILPAAASDLCVVEILAVDDVCMQQSLEAVIPDPVTTAVDAEQATHDKPPTPTLANGGVTPTADWYGGAAINWRVSRPSG
jgi:hypothetical protein